MGSSKVLLRHREKLNGHGEANRTASGARMLRPQPPGEHIEQRWQRNEPESLSCSQRLLAAGNAYCCGYAFYASAE